MYCSASCSLDAVTAISGISASENCFSQFTTPRAGGKAVGGRPGTAASASLNSCAPDNYLTQARGTVLLALQSPTGGLQKGKPSILVGEAWRDEMEAKARRRAAARSRAVQSGVRTKSKVAPRERATIGRFFGDAAKVANELRSFQNSATALSSDHPRLINQYPKQWVAVYEGKVIASSKSFPEVMAELDRQEIPRKSVIVRFIDRNQRTMIL